MSVTRPAGFRAAGVAAGLKASGGLDVALVVNDGPGSSAAAVYTANRCRAHPVLWSEQVSADGIVRAVVLNSGGANCFTGPDGFAVTHATAEAVARHLGIGAGDVVVCSTGLIGEALDAERILAGVDAAAAALHQAAGPAAATAIMTTDSVAKTVAIDSPGGDWSIGGMAKGAGMLAPGLATMLVVLTTDADVDATTCDSALRRATARTFDRLDTDGCMSTNDTVVLLASGASGVRPAPDEFGVTLQRACLDLTRQLQADAEGADHRIDITVAGAVSEDEAVAVARAVARSALVKTAVFGRDPNWGRILAAVGTTAATFDPFTIDVSINGVMVCRSGAAGTSRNQVDLTGPDVDILVDLHAGPARATVWTTDLTTAYVHENSAYSS